MVANHDGSHKSRRIAIGRHEALRAGLTGGSVLNVTLSGACAVRRSDVRETCTGIPYVFGMTEGEAVVPGTGSGVDGVVASSCVGATLDLELIAILVRDSLAADGRTSVGRCGCWHRNGGG